MGLMDDIPTCEQLLSRMVADCRGALRAALARVDA
jgi:nitronate monooxygenase